ncbi:MAG: glycosyl hydrolase [Zoogloea sp.]|nr:MAG: glycosyl hydrolase [Zoogloea sp.]
MNRILPSAAKPRPLARLHRLGRRYRNRLILALLGAAAGLARAEAPAAPPAVPALQAARANPHADQAMLLGATRAGSRLVAVGDHGTVILSDDGGKTFRQARQVPVRAMLNAVSFIDDRQGWAAGHRGVILATTDGGETWTLQRQDLDKDQPLFSVLFTDAQHGWACGLWSLLLRTDDGGKTWQPVSLPVPPGAKRADRNLYSLFADRKGGLFIAAEQGRVVHSRDGGASWDYLDTGYKGSLWAGIALEDGSLLVGGLRGALYRSDDGGSHWAPLKAASLSSITAFSEGAGGQVMASALDGVSLLSTDGGRQFSATQRPDRQPLTALIAGGAGRPPVLFSKAGVLAGQ